MGAMVDALRKKVEARYGVKKWVIKKAVRSVGKQAAVPLVQSVQSAKPKQVPHHKPYYYRPHRVLF